MWSFRSVGVAICLVVAGLTFAAAQAPAARAQATAVPDVVEENLDSATEFIADESGVATAPCDSGCADLKRDYVRTPTAPEDPVQPSFLKSLLDKAVDVGGKVPWPTLPATALEWTGAGALVAANYYVWKVRVIDPIHRAYFVSIPKGVVDEFDATGGAIHFMFEDGTDDEFISYGPKPDPIPFGWIAWTNVALAMMYEVPDEPGLCQPKQYAPIATMPTGMVDFHWTRAICPGGSPVVGHGWRLPMNEAFKFFNGPNAYDAPDSPRTTDLNGTIMTFQEIHDRLQKVLTSTDPDYAPLAPWMCAVFGGEMPEPQRQLPDDPRLHGRHALSLRGAVPHRRLHRHDRNPDPECRRGSHGGRRGRCDGYQPVGCS